jgi:CRISPR-associated protein Cst2
MNKGLTATIIIEAQSLNYDEGFGNLSVLKKIRRGDGDVFTYASRQSLRYSIVKQGEEQFDWKLAPVIKKTGSGGGEGVLQADPAAYINDSEDIDLFGYMKTDVAVGKKTDNKDTEETLTRTAVARITPAISLEPFYNDVEFLNSKWMADRAAAQPNIANIEQHRSFYKYTLTIDLDRIGTEVWNMSITNLKEKLNEESWNGIKDGYLRDIANELKNQRVNELLEVIKNLYRDIRGRREDLKPLFIIGGIFPVKNPFFMNTVRIEWENKRPKIIADGINQVLASKYCYKINTVSKEESVDKNTVIGIRKGIFVNKHGDFKLVESTSAEANNKDRDSDLEDYASPEEAIDKLKSWVVDYFKVQ